jgi:hypothetical protein
MLFLCVIVSMSRIAESRDTDLEVRREDVTKMVRYDWTNWSVNALRECKRTTGGAKQRRNSTISSSSVGGSNMGIDVPVSRASLSRFTNRFVANNRA